MVIPKNEAILGCLSKLSTSTSLMKLIAAYLSKPSSLYPKILIAIFFPNHLPEKTDPYPP